MCVEFVFHKQRWTVLFHLVLLDVQMDRNAQNNMRENDDFG